MVLTSPQYLSQHSQIIIQLLGWEIDFQVNQFEISYGETGCDQGNIYKIQILFFFRYSEPNGWEMAALEKRVCHSLFLRSPEAPGPPGVGQEAEGVRGKCGQEPPAVTAGREE